MSLNIISGTKSLDLGCGLRPKNPYNADHAFGIDVREVVSRNIVSADLAVDAIPFPSQTFDFVTAYDVLEHIPRILYIPQRRNAFVELMNEVYRVLKPGGFFLSSTPAFPDARVFRDPTHVNYITEETFPLYFGDAYQADQYCWASMYGFKGAFKIKTQIWQSQSLLTIMKKVAPVEGNNLQNNVQMMDDKIIAAQELERHGDLGSAKAMLWEVHQAEPNEIRPIYLLSRIALAQNDFNESLRISEFGVLVQPSFAAIYLIKGDSLGALGRHEEALESYSNALSIYPDFIEALIKKGSVLKYLRLDEQAILSYKEAFLLDPTNLEINNLLK